MQQLYAGCAIMEPVSMLPSSICDEKTFPRTLYENSMIYWGFYEKAVEQETKLLEAEANTGFQLFNPT